VSAWLEVRQVDALQLGFRSSGYGRLVEARVQKASNDWTGSSFALALSCTLVIEDSYEPLAGASALAEGRLIRLAPSISPNTDSPIIQCIRMAHPLCTTTATRTVTQEVELLANETILKRRIRLQIKLSSNCG